jgi:hypothetical protein
MRFWTHLFILLCLSLCGVEHVYLKTPDLSRENITGVVAGIRPYRKTGIRLEAEKIQDKLIIHNYGYGGSGLTLCFGGAKRVLDILNTENLSTKTVAILGAGVIGLATAYDLLEQGYDVHIYSDAWSPDLTSNVAAGIWSPPFRPVNMPTRAKELNEWLLKVSEERYLRSTTDQPEFAGVRFITSYNFKTHSPHEDEKVIAHFDNGTVKHGSRTYELALDGKLFMEDLFSQVKAKGALLMQRHFNSLEELLQLEETILINCTSMGSQELFNDPEFIPARGQLVYFNAQEGVDYMLYQNTPKNPGSWVTIYPWSDRIILGGIYEDGEEEAITTAEVINMLIENGQKCLSGEL